MLFALGNEKTTMTDFTKIKPSIKPKGGLVAGWSVLCSFFVLFSSVFHLNNLLLWRRNVHNHLTIIVPVSLSPGWKIEWDTLYDLIQITKCLWLTFVNNMIVSKWTLNFFRWLQNIKCFLLCFYYMKWLQLWFLQIKSLNILVGPLQSLHLLSLNKTVICWILWARNWKFDWQDKGKRTHITSQLV